MTLFELDNHLNNIIRLSDAKEMLLYYESRVLKAVSYQKQRSSSTEVNREPEQYILLREKQKAHIAELEEEIKDFEANELLPYLNGIDLKIYLKEYMALYLRYMCGNKWDAVARAMNIETEAIKKRCYRYLLNHHEDKSSN